MSFRSILSLTGSWYPLLRPTVTLFHPLYGSIRSIQNPQSESNQQLWLTYWILYSLITLFEFYCWKVLARILLWPYLKLAFCFWLTFFNGATLIFEKLLVKNNDQNIINPPSGINDHHQVLETLNPEAKKFADQFIKEYGSGSFNRILRLEKRRRLKQLLHDAAF